MKKSKNVVDSRTPEQIKADQDAAQQRRQRKEFLHTVINGRTVEEATRIAWTIIKEANVRGASPVSDSYVGGGVSLNVQRGSGIKADLYIKFEHDWDARRVNPDNKSQAVDFFEVSVDISWSGTSRDISLALSNVKLYEELIELGAEIQSVLGETAIKRLTNIPVTEDGDPACRCGGAYGQPTSPLYRRCEYCDAQEKSNMDAIQGEALEDHIAFETRRLLTVKS